MNKDTINNINESLRETRKDYARQERAANRQRKKMKVDEIGHSYSLDRHMDLIFGQVIGDAVPTIKQFVEELEAKKFNSPKKLWDWNDLDNAHFGIKPDENNWFLYGHDQNIACCIAIKERGFLDETIVHVRRVYDRTRDYFDKSKYNRASNISYFKKYNYIAPEHYGNEHSTGWAYQDVRDTGYIATAKHRPHWIGWEAESLMAAGTIPPLRTVLMDTIWGFNCWKEEHER